VRLVKKGLKRLWVRKFVGVKDGVGGVAYKAQDTRREFFGKIQPIQDKSEFSLAGYVYSAEFLLITDEKNIGLESLDEISDGERGFVVLGVKEYDGHIEASLEMKKGKGAMTGG